MSFPDDVDGDVLRRLELDGFDFSKPHEVEFCVDFESWPPSQKAIEILCSKFGSVEVIEPDEEDEGYIIVKVKAEVTHSFVVHYQDEISLIVGSEGGVCESWGILHG